jgi:hypothetical protein
MDRHLSAFRNLIGTLTLTIKPGIFSLGSLYNCSLVSDFFRNTTSDEWECRRERIQRGEETQKIRDCQQKYSSSSPVPHIYESGFTMAIDPTSIRCAADGTVWRVRPMGIWPIKFGTMNFCRSLADLVVHQHRCVCPSLIRYYCSSGVSVAQESRVALLDKQITTGLDARRAGLPSPLFQRNDRLER